MKTANDQIYKKEYEKYLKLLDKSPELCNLHCSNEESSNEKKLSIEYEKISQCETTMQHFEELAAKTRDFQNDAILGEESGFEITYQQLSQIQVTKTQKYHFAILIDRMSDPSYMKYGCRWQYSEKQLTANIIKGRNNLNTVAEKLIQVGAELDLLYDAEQASMKNCYILLVHFPDEKLKQANIEMAYHRWVEDPNSILFLKNKAHQRLTYAEKIQNAEMIITRRAGLQKGKLGIISILPLQCYEFQRKFMMLLMKKMNIIRIITAYLVVTRRQVSDKVKKACHYVNDFMSRKKTRDIFIYDIDNKPFVIDVSELDNEKKYLLDSKFFVYEIRRHYGERVALYFAYIQNYTQFLIYPTFIGLFIAFGKYFVTTRSHNKMLIFGGMLICSLWAPLWSKMWRRKNNELNAIWGQPDSRHMYLNTLYDSNQGACGGWCRLCGRCGGTISDEVRKKEDQLPESQQQCRRFLRNFPVSVLIFVSVISIILVMIFCTALLVNAYIQLKTIPSCLGSDAEKSFVSVLGIRTHLCFTGFTRWCAILLQGIVLGLVIDIFQLSLLRMLARFFTVLQNYKYQEEFDNSFIFKIFCFDWLSLYFWFFALCFVYVPFGKRFAIFLRENVGEQWSFDYKENGHLDLRDTFVTPLVVTQLLNLLLETFAPYLIARIYYNRRKSSALNKAQQTGHSSDQRMAKEEAKILATELTQAYCKTGQIEALAQCGPGQQTYFDVIVESEQSEYSSYTAYNDMILQYGYVVMFSVVWPWIPLCAFINNILD